MQNDLTFTNFLKDVSSQFEKIIHSKRLLSICLELPSIDLLDIYQYFLDKYSFSAFWEENYKMSYIAFDKCQSLEFNGFNKYEVAKDFKNKVFDQINIIPSQNQIVSAAKILYFFSFDDSSHKTNFYNKVPKMEAILPRILITTENGKSFLRINAELNDLLNLEEIAKEIWNIRKQIISLDNFKDKIAPVDKKEIKRFYSLLKKSNQDSRIDILKGMNLINNGSLQKIVLAKRINFQINHQFNLIQILRNFRFNLSNSCIYVWKRSTQDITFGASPEKLFSISEKIIKFEAIAGTASSDTNADFLLQSSKDLREHDFVIDYLLECLKILKINNYDQGDLRVVSFGMISHLCTEISAKYENYCPFDFLKTLHPSPAVCGVPKNKSIDWIDFIESFSRNNYAAPIGWVDSNCNSDFRVAIRCARYIEKELQLTAGSGLVRGSILEKELEEINLKLESLAKQIFY